MQMEEGRIRLKAREFNEWMDGMGAEITRIKDNLALLEEGGRGLSKIWEGGAMEEWERGLLEALRQTKECAAKMEALTGKAKERAQSLAQMEKIMLGAAEEL